METLSPDLNTLPTGDLDGLPIDAKTMFIDHKGVHKPRVEKKQRALAKKLGFLKGFLEDGEKLLLITTAVSPTPFFEQLTTGMIFTYIKRCLLVVTDRRIFHIPSTAGYSYRQSIAQIRHSDIETIKQKGARLYITYKSGAKDLFLYIRRSERKTLRALLPSLDMQGNPSTTATRMHLCPKCKVELEKDRFQCPGCDQEFKSKKRAQMLSIWVPGGGYFYTGHPFLGIGDAIFEAALIFFIIFSLIPTIEFPEPDYAGAAIFAVILIVEKLITIYHANHFVREFLPRS